LLLWIAGCSLSLLLLLLVCVAAGDDFQPGLLFCLSRPAGPLQIACNVGPLGAGLGYKDCCFDAAGFWDSSSLAGYLMVC
jgi:hypothetical protein